MAYNPRGDRPPRLEDLRELQALAEKHPETGQGQPTTWVNDYENACARYVDALLRGENPG